MDGLIWDHKSWTSSIYRENYWDYGSESDYDNSYRGEGESDAENDGEGGSSENDAHDSQWSDDDSSVQNEESKDIHESEGQMDERIINIEGTQKTQEALKDQVIQKEELPDGPGTEIKEDTAPEGEGNSESKVST